MYGREALRPADGGLGLDGYIETLIRAAPPRTRPAFYRTAAGAEMDLLLDMPGPRRWAIEVKRNAAPKLTRGFHQALEDVAPKRAFVVYPGTERYPLNPQVEAIGLHELAQLLDDAAAPARA